MDIQSEVIFINGTVHLLQERNFGTPIILPSPATPPSSLTATHEAIFRHTFNTGMYKIIATCIERATAMSGSSLEDKEATKLNSKAFYFR